jgi:DNA-binding winged helix-turn-helix (wHTH) protein
VPPGDSAAGPKLLNGSRPPELGQEHADREPARTWDEHVPPPGRDATLLAVVPIPGTGTSLAIVGYVIATSANQPPAGPDQAGRADQAGRQPAAAARTPGSGPGLRLDHRQRRVWADGREIKLTFQEFELLAFLAAHPARVFTRADLVSQVWHRDLGHDGRPVPQDSRTVDVHVSRLRRKLGPRHGQCLVTEYRVGYQFRPVTREPPHHASWRNTGTPQRDNARE